MYRILIAEDEPRIAAFMEKGLRRSGFSTVVASDGNFVLEAIINNGFDLLLLDLGLPGKDGQEVLVEMRKQGIMLPVIIVTARSMDLRNSELQTLANDIVSKPFLMRALLAKVRSLLE
ncbi:MAG: response regulator [Cyanobacteria bacterium J06636_16]